MMIRTPARMLLRKNSWPMPRKTAFTIAIASVLPAASAPGRRAVCTPAPPDTGAAGSTPTPSRPCATCSPVIRNSKVIELNAKVNGGTPNAPTNTAASAPISTEEAALNAMIHTTTRTSQAGVRNSASASPTRTPLNPYSPAWMRPRRYPACGRRASTR